MGKKSIKNKFKKIKLIYPTNYLIKDNFFWITTNIKTILKNFKSIKDFLPNKEEIDFLNRTIINLNEEVKPNKDTIFIAPLFKEIINQMKPVNLILSDEAKKIKEIIEQFPPKKTFYIKDISKEYSKKYDKTLSRKKIYNIIRNTLNYRFKRTSIKNNKIISDKGLFMSFFFYKTVLRGLLLGIEPIFIDETGFQIQNNKYYRWRLPQEEYPYGAKKDTLKKINLILAVSNKQVIYYKINEENTNSEIFETFLRELFEKIPKDLYQKKLIIMDNARFHLTNNVRNLCKESKIKVITISPYNSDQNMIELMFRHIKNLIKRKSYKSLKKMETKIENILKNNENQILLKRLFRRTLIYYNNFIEKNKNDIKIEEIFKEIISNKK